MKTSSDRGVSAEQCSLAQQAAQRPDSRGGAARIQISGASLAGDTWSSASMWIAKQY